MIQERKINNMIDAFKHLGSKEHVIELGIDQSNLKERVDTNRFLMWIMGVFLALSLILSGVCAVVIKRNEIQTQTQIELLARCIFAQQVMIEELENKQNFDPFNFNPLDGPLNNPLDFNPLDLDLNPLDDQLDLSDTDVDKVTQRE